MKLFPPEPKIDLYNQGFGENDILGRAETGRKLSNLVETIETPLVVALDGAWGSGKSHFLKTWVGAHTLENDGKAKTIYFDAFEHDYLDDPLVALIGVLADRFQNKDKGALKKARDAVSKLWRPALRIGIAATTAGASELAGPLIDAGLAAGSNELSKASEIFWKREDGKRAAMVEFRAALEELTPVEEDGGDSRKIVIVIDELDRCRPDYALSMLEVMKHFFAVENVHFILGVNLKELENSVRARYGSGVDAAKYLQKFVSVIVPIKPPRPARGTFSDYRAYFDLLSKQLKFTDDWRYKWIREYLTMINHHVDVGLRDVQMILANTMVTPDLQTEHEEECHVYIGLLVLRVIRPSWINDARFGNLEFSKLDDFFKLSSRDLKSVFFGESWAVWRLVLDPLDQLDSPIHYQKILENGFEDSRQDVVSNIIALYIDAVQLIDH